VFLLYWLRYFREKRKRENLPQVELLKRELAQIGLALVTIVLLFAFLIGLVLYFGQ
jgi:hypothetical protein